jgi:hypothetical protein
MKKETERESYPPSLKRFRLHCYDVTSRRDKELKCARQRVTIVEWSWELVEDRTESFFSQRVRTRRFRYQYD